MSKDAKDLKARLLKIVDDLAAEDKKLREELGIGDKFRFIRDRVGSLKTHMDEALASIQFETDEEKGREVRDDEQVVYVYLFNAHGIDVQTWHKMLHPSVYYEYSINRPIYQEKDHIESFIRSKSDKTQHGYLTVAVQKNLISSQGGSYKDNLGHPLVKIREGSLKPERLLHFAHNGELYQLNENGGLKKLD